MAAGTLAAAGNGKLPLHAAMNSFHAPWLDALFKGLTLLADGWVPTALALAALFMGTWRSFLLLGLGSGLSAIITQVLKRFVFDHMDRPSMFRDALIGMPWVDGVELHAHHSFPSGHSTAAFSMCFALAILAGRRQWAVPLALLAALMAHSRIYLSQHFLQDTLAGATIGTLTAFGVYRALYRSRFASREWLAKRPFGKGTP